MPSPIFLLYIRSIGGVTTAFNMQFDILPKQRKAHFSTHKRVLKWAFHIDSLQTEDFQKNLNSATPSLSVCQEWSVISPEHGG